LKIRREITEDIQTHENIQTLLNDHWRNQGGDFNVFLIPRIKQK
jgi:hypothetical protein